MNLRKPQFCCCVFALFCSVLIYAYISYLVDRWKGENVATTEVSEVLGCLEFLQDVNVYGVTVPGFYNFIFDFIIIRL